MNKPNVCLGCGAPVSGPFCSACGAAQQTLACPGCGAPVASNVRFCGQCGRPARGSGAPRTLVPYLVGGGLVLALLAALFVRERQARPAETATGTSTASGPVAGTPPELSSMTPRERFDRLYNRIMTASESGDTTTLSQFMPMALSAYSMLDSVDADARYHAAMLRLHTGDVDGAAALADTILTNDRTHLFGFVIRGTLARWERNETALTAAHRAFLAQYQAEMARNRPEYRDHQVIIDQFHTEAKGDAEGSR